MRLYEISSNKKEYFDITPEEAIALIKRDCQPYLHETSGTRYLWRGVKGCIAPFIRKEVQKNRRPRDMHPDLHHMLVMAFKELGFKAHRGNSVFCTSRFSWGLEDYGNVYAIFPIGEFSVTWSWRVADLTEQLRELKISNFSSYEEIKQFVKDYYEQGNIQQAMETSNEIMIECDRYYGIIKKAHFKSVKWDMGRISLSDIYS